MGCSRQDKKSLWQGIETGLSLIVSELPIALAAYAVLSSERLRERESLSKNASSSNTFSTSLSPVSVSIVDTYRD